MNTKTRFKNDWAVLSQKPEEAKRIQAELESRLPAEIVHVTMWLDNGLPRVDIAYDDNRVMRPREYLQLGEALVHALRGKGILLIAEMTPNSLCVYINRLDLMAGPPIPGQFDGMGAEYEVFRNCWEQDLAG